MEGQQVIHVTFDPIIPCHVDVETSPCPTPHVVKIRIVSTREVEPIVKAMEREI